MAISAPGSAANSDGNRADSVGLMPDGRRRLGNEEDTKIELIPTVTLTADSGVVAKVQANLTTSRNAPPTGTVRMTMAMTYSFVKGSPS